jgi:DNA-binding MarR family transcriptional regulator
MSSRLPSTSARAHPENLAILLREAFAALNDRALARLAERGHGAVRPAHAAVFQYLDDAGTTVSALAERTHMTKQSMAELVRHLEGHGYVERVPDPSDRRAKLVRATDRGRTVFAIVREYVVETEERLTSVLGAARMRRLRDDLETLRRAVPEADETSA